MSCKLFVPALLLLSWGLRGSNVSQAQTEPNVGYVTGTQDLLSSLPLADGREARRLLLQLTVTTDDPANPFNLATQDCFATYVFEDEVPVAGYGACDGISVDGDMWWLSLRMGDDGLVYWRTTGGTGRFADVESSGTTESLAQWDDGKLVGRFTGTYTRK